MGTSRGAGVGRGDGRMGRTTARTGVERGAGRAMGVDGAYEVGAATLHEYLRARAADAVEASTSAREAEDCENEAAIVRALARTCAKIGRFVRRAGLTDVKAYVEGKNGAVNVHGEEQAALDDAAHEMCVEALREEGSSAWIASEESEDVVAANPRGRIAVVFDPLDGSSNIECGVGVGTIFGLVGVDENSAAASVYARPGNDMRSVGYVMYGASTILVLSFMSTGAVCAFTYDESLDAFVLTKANIRIPTSGNVYSVNQANYRKWDDVMRAYIDECSKEKKSLRYIGSMVADVHRTLLYGGTFHYPADASNPNGKLRAVYECFPMSAIIERAGGLAISAADTRVLDFVPTSAHERMPIHVGSPADIERLSQMYRESPGGAAAARSTFSPL